MFDTTMDLLELLRFMVLLGIPQAGTSKHSGKKADEGQEDKVYHYITLRHDGTLQVHGCSYIWET